MAGVRKSRLSSQYLLFELVSLTHKNATVVWQDQERGQAIVKLTRSRNHADEQLTSQGAGCYNKAQYKWNWPPKIPAPTSDDRCMANNVPVISRCPSYKNTTGHGHQSQHHCVIRARLVTSQWRALPVSERQQEALKPARRLGIQPEVTGAAVVLPDRDRLASAGRFKKPTIMDDQQHQNVVSTSGPYRTADDCSREEDNWRSMFIGRRAPDNMGIVRNKMYTMADITYEDLRYDEAEANARLKVGDMHARAWSYANRATGIAGSHVCISYMGLLLGYISKADSSDIGKDGLTMSDYSYAPRQRAYKYILYPKDPEQMGAIALIVMKRTGEKTFLKWVLCVTGKHGNYLLEVSGGNYYSTADRNNIWVVLPRGDGHKPCAPDRVSSPKQGGIPSFLGAVFPLRRQQSLFLYNPEDPLSLPNFIKT